MQKLIARQRSMDLEEEVNNYLDDGWAVVPHTHIAAFKNIAMAGGGSAHGITEKSTDYGYFAIVVEKD